MAVTQEDLEARGWVSDVWVAPHLLNPPVSFDAKPLKFNGWTDMHQPIGMSAMFGNCYEYGEPPVSSAKAEFTAKQISAAADVLRKWQRGNVSGETIFEEAVQAANAAA